MRGARGGKGNEAIIFPYSSLFTYSLSVYSLMMLIPDLHDVIPDEVLSEGTIAQVNCTSLHILIISLLFINIH